MFVPREAIERVLSVPLTWALVEPVTAPTRPIGPANPGVIPLPYAVDVINEFGNEDGPWRSEP